MLVRLWRKGDPPAPLVGMQAGVATGESSVEFSQKIKNGTALLHSDSTSGHISEDTQNTDSKEYIHPSVHCSVFTIAKI